MTMSVTLLGTTALDAGAIEDRMELEDGSTAADTLAVFSGRLCYQAFGKKREATRLDHDYLGNIIGQGHFSVLGHAHATILISGVSRTLTHELIRHRWFTFSELSQRYVNAEDFEPVIPPDMEEDEAQDLLATFTYGIDGYKRALESLESRGVDGKKARQAARAHLANCTATEIVATSNLRGWRDFITQRNSPAADTEIHMLAERILEILDGVAPGTFQDLV